MSSNLAAPTIPHFHPLDVAIDVPVLQQVVLGGDCGGRLLIFSASASEPDLETDGIGSRPSYGTVHTSPAA